MNWIWTPIAGILSGILASMGLGGGGILIIYLTIFAGIEQATAQGINLVFFIPISIVAILIYYLLLFIIGLNQLFSKKNTKYEK